jgi:hypothetical protein
MLTCHHNVDVLMQHTIEDLNIISRRWRTRNLTRIRPVYFSVAKGRFTLWTKSHGQEN